MSKPSGKGVTSAGRRRQIITRHVILDESTFPYSNAPALFGASQGEISDTTFNDFLDWQYAQEMSLSPHSNGAHNVPDIVGTPSASSPCFCEIDAHYLPPVCPRSEQEIQPSTQPLVLNAPSSDALSVDSPPAAGLPLDGTSQPSTFQLVMPFHPLKATSHHHQGALPIQWLMLPFVHHHYNPLWVYSPIPIRPCC